MRPQLLAPVVLLMLAGCISKTHFAADITFANSVQGTIVFIREQMKAVEQYVELKHEYQKRLYQTELDSFWAKHTDVAGGVVSVNELGEQVPMPLEQVQKVFGEYQARLEKLAESERIYTALHGRLETTLTQLDRIAAAQIEGIISDADALTQAQNLLSSLIGAGGAISIAAIAGGL